MSSNSKVLSIVVERLGCEPAARQVRLGPAFNFGYSGRDPDIVREHVREMAERGVAEPTSTPSLYPVPPDRITIADEIDVYGRETYAEVEYALLLAGTDWLVTVGADQTDSIVERVSVSRAKRQCHDVVAPVFWPLVDVAVHFDQLELSLAVLRSDGQSVNVQRDICAAILRPEALVDTLRERTGGAVADGTIFLSGTIGGAPPLGVGKWRMSLTDRVLGREISRTFRVNALAEELPLSGGESRRLA